MTYEEHFDECRLMYVVPLTPNEWARLHDEGLDGEAAYSVACDLGNGWSWEEAVEALKNSV